MSTLQPHFACFCDSGDLLSQWRAYADHGGGYAIGFETLPLAMPEDFLRPPKEADLLQVEYDPSVPKNTLQEQVESLRCAVDECVSDEPAAESEIIPAACMLFRERLADHVFSYKHSAFSEEREWRLVCLRHRDDRMLELRTGTGFLVPYRELSSHMRSGPNTGNFPFRTSSSAQLFILS